MHRLLIALYSLAMLSFAPAASAADLIGQADECPPFAVAGM